ncbi:MAG: hypothetical protein NT155_04795 [Candidatus Staskawiczbacteria bacterium]|nr:hypothetical protein [Candidatus Staskawiczbacteria bacterium]
MIKTLQEFYLALDKLLLDISDACEHCAYDDCKGYIWLLPAESSMLFRVGVPILEINKGVLLISPFKKGETDIEKLKPDCPCCKNRRCTIRRIRPLACRMYPLSFLRKDDKVHLVLHLDCQYAKDMEGNQAFRSKVKVLLKSIDPKLMMLILKVYLSYEELTKFPFGPNRCHILATVVGQKEKPMSKCRAVMDSAKVTSLTIKQRKPKARRTNKKSAK